MNDGLDKIHDVVKKMYLVVDKLYHVEIKVSDISTTQEITTVSYMIYVFAGKSYQLYFETQNFANIIKQWNEMNTSPDPEINGL